MKEIDRMIRDALREEDAEMFDKFGGDQPIHEKITDLFRFRPRWLLLSSILTTLVAMAIAVFAAIRFYNTAEVRDMLVWGGICFACLLGVAAIKIWAWMEMSKNAVTREIKRLELQIVYLAGKMSKLPNAPDSD
jgi:hypothetical protein